MPRKAKRSAPKRFSLARLLKGDKYILALWLIMLCGVLLIHFFYTGPYLQFDDQKYLALVAQVGNHTFSPAINLRAYSWLFIYLSYLSGAIFGQTQSGFVALVAIEYLSLILLTYILGLRVTGDKKLSLFAAFLVCIFPFTIQYSSRLLPDMLMGVLGAISAVMLFSDRKVDWVLSGAAAGLMLYVKLMAFAYLIPFAIAALISRKRAYVIPAMLITMAIYTIPFIVYVHNPFFAFQNYGGFQELLSPTTPGNNLLGLMLMGSLWQSTGPISINFQNYQLGLLLWFAALGTVMSVKYMDGKMVAMSGLFWVFTLYLCFGTISLSHYAVGSFITRYFIVVAAPFAILVAYAVKNLVVKFPISGRRNWVHMAIFLALLIGIIVSLWGTYHLVYYYNEMIRLNPAWLPPNT